MADDAPMNPVTDNGVDDSSPAAAAGSDTGSVDDARDTAGTSSAAGAGGGAGAGAGSRGSRTRTSRKQVAHYRAAARVKKELYIPAGAGVTLGDVDYVAEMVRKEKPKSEFLTAIYRLFFNRAPKQRVMRKNILLFSGLDPAGDRGQQLEKLEAKLVKFQLAKLRKIMDILGVNRSALSFEDKKATKDNLVTRLAEWIVKPTATKQKAPSAKRKRSKASKTKKRASADTDDEAEEQTPPKKKKARKKKAKKAPLPESEDESDDSDDEIIPDGVGARVKEIVTEADVTSLSMKEVFRTIEAEFSLSLAKHQKKFIKAIVLRTVVDA